MFAAGWWPNPTETCGCDKTEVKKPVEALTEVKRALFIDWKGDAHDAVPAILRLADA